MASELLKIGAFAKLARTTKRTVLWYEEKGLLLPREVGKNLYRYYHPEQAIDYQAILLLRTLHFSLEEIRGYLKNKQSLGDVFRAKESVLREELEALQNTLDQVHKYYENLDATSTLVSPTIKHVPAQTVYTLQKTGSFDKIKQYGHELRSLLREPSETAKYFTLFFDAEYRPKRSKMELGVIADNKCRPREPGKLQKRTLPGFTALSYHHKGSGALLSMLWQELWRYAKEHGYEPDTSLPFVDQEVYHKTSLNGTTNESEMEFELLLPVRPKF